jgi:regulatory protein
VSDERAVESLINQKISRCGAIKLRMELNRLDVDSELIESSILKIKSSEYQRAFELLIKRYKHAPINLKEIISQKNFLMRRGFGFDICNRAVDDRSKPIRKII